MSEVTINSNICRFMHMVSGERKGKNITIDIKTDCEKIKKMSHMEVRRFEMGMLSESLAKKSGSISIEFK